MIRVYMKSGNIYVTPSITIVNDGKDMQFMDIEGDYVIVSVNEVDSIGVD